jgi:SPP1 family predicted phage head-tail adaptor
MDSIMKIGELNKRIEIQSETHTFDSHGGEVRTWTTDSTVWASVKTLTGRKLELARQIEAETTIEVRIRFCGTSGVPGITMANRILYGARIFEPTYIVNENEASIVTLIMCKEAVVVDYE